MSERNYDDLLKKVELEREKMANRQAEVQTSSLEHELEQAKALADVARQTQAVNNLATVVTTVMTIGEISIENDSVRSYVEKQSALLLRDALKRARASFTGK